MNVLNIFFTDYCRVTYIFGFSFLHDYSVCVFFLIPNIIVYEETLLSDRE